MLRELTVPELGENVESAIVVSILVGTGDSVDADQAVAELETEKATAELPCPFAGQVQDILIKVGDEVKVGQVVMRVETEAAGVEDAPAPAPIAPAPAPSAPAPAPSAPAPAPSAPAPAPVAPTPVSSAVDLADIPAAPAARRLARELGIAIAEVTGSGRGGRISSDDIKAHARKLITTGGLAEAPAATASAGELVIPPLPDFSKWGETEREPMSGVRRKTAEAMSQSWRMIPHVTQNDRADITGLDSFRRAWGNQKTESGAKLTVTAVIIKAVASALKLFPRFNGAIDVLNNETVFKKYINIGVAVDAGHGLLVPVLRDVDTKSIVQIVDELADVSTRARAKKLSIDEMRGANLTISNLGGLGTTHFTPIVNWPESANLGVGRAHTEAIWNDGAFGPRLILPLSLSYDHRLNDGADAARFLRWISEALEEPIKLVMEA